jgi:hypothetical protein
MDSRFSKSIAQVNSRDIQCERQVNRTLSNIGGGAGTL